MSEFQRSTPRIILDGAPIPDGRSRRRDDGSYRAYDLTEAEPGDTLVFITDQGAHELMKVNSKHGPMEGWQRSNGEAALGLVLRLMLFEPNDKGPGQIRTSGVIVRENLHVGVVELGATSPKYIQSLGVVAGILCNHSATVERREQIRTS